MTFDDAAILAELDDLRRADAPTHGGRVLSYVYDSGMPELDELAAQASRRMQSVNGLDPTTFTSVAALEREVVAFARDILGGDEGVVGSVTSGGTESCLLAVRTARDLWRAAGGIGTPRIVAPVTAHAAFRKAAELFELAFDPVPVSPETGTVEPSAIIERLGPDVALVVVSAPSYPFAAMDPIAPVAAACAASGISCHVDACIGGWILPFWPDAAARPGWDLRVPGVTSLSADLHKYGYAPKGVSVPLHRGRDRHRAQYFATTDWPGYPVVNPTLLGSKSAGALAAAWAIIRALGVEGFAQLAGRAARATAALQAAVAGIEGCGWSEPRPARCSRWRPTSRCRRSAASTRTTGPIRRALPGGCSRATRTRAGRRHPSSAYDASDRDAGDRVGAARAGAGARRRRGCRARHPVGRSRRRARGDAGRHARAA
ncbi:pyridoxal phosphate-dependent decarboxylase family protein [Microbacterium elymi]|uniref:Pyridoxal-dependent decarboxylase n=1 Tax=Microbacterium elymi TaxID=2909587 RepID=A0ABY5NHZ5_9MICO|nr:pyridoxal-dependent decarboxylase [Microbacterium elymi]UUT34807.1 pyridoxal-dependent decarboxylase [Microbacterium elymi]